MDQVKLGEGEMDGVAFQRLDDGAFEQTEARPCNNLTRAAVEDEQQWGLEQCGCRQETEVRLARKSIGFLPTITSNSIEHKGRTISTSIAEESSQLQLCKLQGGRSSQFLPEAPLPLSFLRNDSTQHSALSCNEIHIQEKLLSVHQTNASSLRRELTIRASFLMKTKM